MRKVDLTGERFGKLVVLRDSGNKGTRIWTCECDCGTVIDVFGVNLTTGRTKSCGCSKRRHGDSTSKLYATFMRMGRSEDGREWDTYPEFRDWAMANGYQEGMTFRRIDTGKPFGPENCKIEGEN